MERILRLDDRCEFELGRGRPRIVLLHGRHQRDRNEHRGHRRESTRPRRLAQRNVDQLADQPQRGGQRADEQQRADRACRP